MIWYGLKIASSGKPIGRIWYSLLLVFLGHHWLGTCNIWVRSVLAAAHVVEHVLLWSCSRVEGSKGDECALLRERQIEGEAMSRSLQPSFGVTCQQWTLEVMMGMNLTSFSRLREFILIWRYKQEKQTRESRSLCGLLSVDFAGWTQSLKYGWQIFCNISAYVEFFKS